MMASYKKFNALCNSYGVTAYQVAGEAGITAAALDSWKQGIHSPKWKMLVKIADLFSVDVRCFFEKTDDTEAEEEWPTMPYGMHIICDTPVRTVKVGGVLYASVEDIISALEKENEKRHTGKE